MPERNHGAFIESLTVTPETGQPFLDIGQFLDSLPVAETATAQPRGLSALAQLDPATKVEVLWSLFRELQKRHGALRPFPKEEPVPEPLPIPTPEKYRSIAGQEKLTKVEADKVTLLRALWAEVAVQKMFKTAYTRHLEEDKELNGEYSAHQKDTREIGQLEDEFDTISRELFRQRGRSVSDLDILAYAEIEELLRQKRMIRDRRLAGNPELAAQAGYDRLVTYQRQLERDGFVWEPSRRAALEKLERLLIAGRPIMILSETGAGKTSLVEAAARILTGHEANKAVGGRDTKAEKLFYTRELEGDTSFFRYGPLLEAITGKGSNLAETATHTGRIFFDDEFNKRPTDVQMEIVKFVSALRPGQEFVVPNTSIRETVQPGFAYIAAGNPASARYDREETDVAVENEFAGSTMEIDYLEQSPEKPELYELMLVRLFDGQHRLRTSDAEIKPVWKKDTTTGISTLNLDAKSGGWLWRFAQYWRELGVSFTQRESALHRAEPTTAPEALYLERLVIRLGVVLGWLDEYKKTRSRGSLEVFMVDKLNDFINQPSILPKDKAIATKFATHFGIDLTIVAKDKDPLTRENVTPQDVGRLLPTVPRRSEKGEGRPPDVSAIIFDDSGDEIAYIPGNVGEFAAGTILKRIDGMSVIHPETITILGKNEGDFVIVADSRNCGLIYDYEDILRFFEPVRESAEFTYNETEARRLGLERIDLAAYPKADALLKSVVDGTFKLDTPVQKEMFCRQWRSGCPDLPLPYVLPETTWNFYFPGKPYPANVHKNTGNFWYLEQLKNRKIISNLAGANSGESPHYGEAQMIMADTWVEEDWDAAGAGGKKKLQTVVSPLLRELLGAGTTGVVNIKREDIDVALWIGDPANRVPTPKHRELLVRLGVDPAKYEFHCIRADQYARGAEAKGWGQKNLWTHLDHYFLGGDGSRYGLMGGARGSGGASRVDGRSRGGAYGDLAVRLVLSRNLD